MEKETTPTSENLATCDVIPYSTSTNWLTRIVAVSLSGPLAVLMMVAALLIGGVALYLTPREEEPQIVVPLADVLVSAPGLSARQVERQVATPLEKVLYQIDGVEYVYSTSYAGQAVVTVRFYVGEDREDSLIKIYNKIHSNTDKQPAVVEAWVVKPVEIDDVPIVVATLYSRNPQRCDDHRLRRIAEETVIRLQSVPNTNAVGLVGGRPRKIRVLVDPETMAAHQTTLLDLEFALKASNLRLPSGRIDINDQQIVLESGEFIRNVEELRNLVVNVVDGIPVYLRDVAVVEDGPDEPTSSTWLGFGPAETGETLPGILPAVSIAVPKKKGTNAVWVAQNVAERLKDLQQSFFPPEVGVAIVRDYGETANHKVNELVQGLVVAVITVIILIGMILGWRAALVIALAIPVCYGATMGINLLGGYTINRVTLFAMILALGLLVDDPITDVENISRYLAMRRFSGRKSILLAIQEVQPALIMSTIAIILSFAPMFFITGMMGPYMRPMALNVPVTVTMSTVVAICVTPFLSYLLLSKNSLPVAGENSEYDVQRTMVYRLYNLLIRPVLRRRWLAWLFLLLVGVAFVLAMLLPALRLVPLKMLPFDNKNEFQILLDMPEGSTLEYTDGVLREMAEELRTVPEVTRFVGYVGEPSPMDFNGMVRHYYHRTAPHLADLRVNLVPKDQRQHQSHELVLRIRDQLAEVAQRHGAVMKLVEVPPGPPVIATLTAEVYGEEHTPYETLQQTALDLAERLGKEPFVVDIDTTVEGSQQLLRFITDKEKAALSGIATEDVAHTLSVAIGGSEGHNLQDPTEANPLEIELRLPEALRSDPGSLAALYLKGRPGIVKQQEGGALRNAPQPLVSLRELGEFETRTVDQPIYHKNLRQVVYVFAEVSGRPPADVVLDLIHDHGLDSSSESPVPLEQRSFIHNGGGVAWTSPADTTVVWNGEGEWKITLDVFRDLGIAFGAALVGIFLVLYLQTKSAILSVIIMTSIPLTMIGIMPGFWLLNQIGQRTVEQYPNPVFFTATAMIGMIALAGIVVRNSVVLIDFIHQSLRDNCDLEESLVQSGAIRLRPIVLTAGTTFLGNIVITLDPIFSGLAWSIIFGIAASTAFTLGVVPIVYNLVYQNRPGHGLPVATKKPEDD